jgi:hypothetical protein
MRAWFLPAAECAAGVLGMLLCTLAMAVLYAYLAAEMFRDWLAGRRFR